MPAIPLITPAPLKAADLLREWRLLKDLAHCARDRDLADLPRGQSSVMVIPGFGAGDWATGILRGRLSRLGQFGRLASGVAGGMVAEGARRIADGERPRMRDMLLTPGNVTKVADRLSHLGVLEAAAPSARAAGLPQDAPAEIRA